VRYNEILRGTTALASALGLIAGLAWLFLTFPKSGAPISNPIDFLAFHSAARAAAGGHDPYLSEPLRSFERAALAESKIVIVPNLVVPAPLPPYELAIFAPLGLLSFRLASALWFAGALVALGVTVVLLRRATGSSLFAIVPAVLLADGFASVIIGQIVPFVLCALVAAGYALERDRPRLAAALVLSTALEPHVGLGAMAGLFVCEPRARRTLVAGLAALAVLSLSSGGFARNVEFLNVVLPAQARAEGLELGGQYSLSALLAAFGVSAAVALALGSAWYAAMLVVGAALAGRVARALRHRSAALFFPTALTILGGTYVHVHQFAFALPLLFLILAHPGRIARLALLALLLLAIPWETFFEAGVGNQPAPRHGTVAAQLARVSAGDLPAEAPWGVWVRSGTRDARSATEQLACKLPTWLGLLLLLTLTAARVVLEGRTRSSRPGGTRLAAHDRVGDEWGGEQRQLQRPLTRRARSIPSR
jgi:hypothetical protein